MAIQTTQQARLQDDLRGLVAGQVRCDEIVAQLYATDAGPLEYRPAGVVWPRTAADVSAVVRYCAEEGIPVHPRGSGTTTAGGALGPGVVLDFTRHMRRLLHVEGDTILVQPGAIRERLNDILKRSVGRFFAPSTGFLPIDTLGGILSTDIAGPRWLRYGFPHDFVEELEVVLADGTISNLKTVTQNELAGNSIPSPIQTSAEIIRQAKADLTMEQPALKAGYASNLLREAFNDSGFHPQRLLTGSEGTLGIITKMRLKTSVRAAVSGGVILLFESLEKTADAVSLILNFEPTLCELVDRRTISLICEKEYRLARYLPVGTEYALLVEMQDNFLTSLKDRLDRLVHSVRYVTPLAFGSFTVLSSNEISLFNSILKQSEVALLTLGSGVRLVTLLEDLWVPISSLPDFLSRIQSILRKYNQVYSIGGHLGQGQVRIIPILDLYAQTPMESIDELAEDICMEAVRFGGGVGSAHGLGKYRARFLPTCLPKLFPVFADLKRTFDPKGIMNPQTAISLPENAKYFSKHLPLRQNEILENSLRDHGAKTSHSILEDSSVKETIADVFTESFEEETPNYHIGRRSQLETQFNWDRSSIDSDVYGCTGCGLCRIRTSGLRMCPSFRYEPEEKSSCRAKANILRGILDGTLSLETLSEDSLKQIGDYCVGCHCCKPECPTGIDIPKLSYRIRSAYAGAHGLSLTDKIISNLDLFLHVGSAWSCAFTLFQKGRFSRWLFEKIFGIAHTRTFPKIVRHRFLRQRHFPYRPTEKPSARVVLFIDIFADCYDTALSEAACAVLRKNNVEFVVPSRQRASGHLAFTVGDMPRAERLARFNTRILIDYVRQGYQVVTLEPISAVCLSREYLWQLDNAETRMVAERTTDLSTFLFNLHKEGKFDLSLSPLPKTIGYHAPCRTLALMEKSIDVPTPAEELLRLIPQLDVRRLERGCCGLADPSGFRKENHMASLMLGMPLFLAFRDSAIEFGSTECNFCRLQMEQGTNKRVYHPVKLLAHAYRTVTIPELS